MCSEAHASARHEKQCGDTFTALGMPKNEGFFIPTTWADTGLSEETRLKYAEKYHGCADPDQHADCCLSFFCYWPMPSFDLCCGLGVHEHSSQILRVGSNRCLTFAILLFFDVVLDGSAMMDEIMAEALSMSSSEQTGWKKRKTPNLALANEPSSASSTPV